MAQSKKIIGKTAIVFHNLENQLYEQRAVATPWGPSRWIHALNAKKLQKHEFALASFADELWFNSPKDKLDYQALTSNKSVPLRSFVPFFSEGFISEKRSLRKIQNTDELITVGFVGGLHFRPNQVSAQWIVEKVAPELQKNDFKGKLLIVGKNPPAQLAAQAQAFPFIEILGFLPSLDQYWEKLSLSLSPHVEGSGVRMKLLESLAAGVPVLTHVAAIEQVSDSLKNHPQIYATDSPADWAKKIIMANHLASSSTFGDQALTSPPDWFQAFLTSNQP